MKKKLSKILGLSLTLALLVSMLWAVVPVAGTVSGIAVTLTAGTVAGNPVGVISKDNSYTIVFQAHADLKDGKDSITVVFPATTDASGLNTADNMVQVQNSVGSFAGTANALTNIVKAKAVVAADKVTLTIDLEGTALEDDIREGAYVKIVTTAGANAITNPSAAGNNTLTVKTEAETTAVTSAAYATTNPTIVAVPGIVTGENAAGVTLYQATGGTAINDAIATSGVVTITAPGTYTEDVEADVAGQTISSTGTTAETIISGTVIISKKTTFDGFTVTGTLETKTVDDTTVKNCVLKGEVSVNINSILTDNTYEVATAKTGVIVADGEKATIKGGTFNVAGTGIGISTAGTLDVTTSTFTATGTTETATGIKSTDADETTTITSNTFDGFKIALDIDAGSVQTNRIKWNSILNSVTDAIDAEVAVNATFNWFGTTVVADVKAKLDGTVTVEPLLSGIAADVLSKQAYGVNVALLDAKTTVGVNVVTTTTAADLISLVKFAESPEGALTDAIAFYDVYVIGTNAATDDVSLRFHVGDKNSKLYAWSRATEAWVVQTTGFSAFGGYIHITVDASVLGGTPFAVVQPPVVVATPTIGLPVLQAPDVGDYDVALQPMFAWKAVADADGYYIEVADNPIFLSHSLLAKVDGDVNRITGTAYAYVGHLDYSTGYYWRVKAVRGTIAAGDLVESDWVEGVFRTIDEPEEPPTPVKPVVIEQLPTPKITLAQPDVIVDVEVPDVVVDVKVPLPDVVTSQVTPGWIYAIIVVGGVLVISLIVLIVRTRRVA